MSRIQLKKFQEKIAKKSNVSKWHVCLFNKVQTVQKFSRDPEVCQVQPRIHLTQIFNDKRRAKSSEWVETQDDPNIPESPLNSTAEKYKTNLQ